LIKAIRLSLSLWERVRVRAFAENIERSTPALSQRERELFASQLTHPSEALSAPKVMRGTPLAQ
jgi:hypothetical protein